MPVAQKVNLLVEWGYTWPAPEKLFDNGAIFETGDSSQTSRIALSKSR
jgi:hypothetical protein